MMEVKVKELELLLVLRFIDLPHIFFSQDDFSLLCIWKQINYKYRSVSAQQICKMLVKSLLSHLRSSRYSNAFNHALLFPKYWNWTSYDRIAQYNILRLYYLLCLTKVSNIAIIIDASSIITRATPQMTSARNQSQRNISSLNYASMNSDVALYKRSEPSNVYILLFEVRV